MFIMKKYIDVMFVVRYFTFIVKFLSMPLRMHLDHGDRYKMRPLQTKRELAARRLDGPASGFGKTAKQRRPGPQLKKAAICLFVGFASIQYSVTAKAEDVQQLAAPATPDPVKGDWDVILGGGVGWAPKFEGAKDHRIVPLPIVTVAYKDVAFIGAEGLGVNFIHLDGFRAGLLLGFSGGRQASVDAHLTGLGDIDAAVTAGAFASYSMGFIQINGTIKQAVTDVSQGLQGRLNLLFRFPIIEKTLFVEGGPTVGFADQAYEKTYFGVTETQSLNSGLAMYSPGGGLKDYGANASLTYRMNEQVIMRLMGSVHELQGDVAKSPIVQEKTQTFFGFGAGYKF